MATKETLKKTKSKSDKGKVINEGSSQTKRVAIGLTIVLTAFALVLAFISYFFTWQSDQSVLSEFANKEVVANNLLSKIGAFLGDFFIYKGFGLAILIPTFLLMLTGVKIAINSKIKLLNKWFWGVCWMIYLSVLLGFLPEAKAVFSGMSGFEVNQFLQVYLGLTGTVMLLLLLLLLYLIFKLKVTPDKLNQAYHVSKDKLATIKKKRRGR